MGSWDPVRLRGPQGSLCLASLQVVESLGMAVTGVSPGHLMVPRRPAPKQRAPPLEGAMGWDCGAKTLGVAFVSPRGCGEMVPCGGVGRQVGAVALEEEWRRKRGSF